MKKILFTLFIITTQVTLAQDTLQKDQRSGPVTLSAPNEEVFKVVEVMPTYEGGMQNLYSYLRKNLQYPNDPKDKGIEGTSYVTFVIEKDGSLSDVKIIESRQGDKDLDAEAVRVVKIMPKWVPGTQDGKPVRVQFILPIKFSLGKRK